MSGFAVTFSYLAAHILSTSKRWVDTRLKGPFWCCWERLGLAGFLLSIKSIIMRRPTEITEVTPMRLGTKKVAIGIALGTLVLAILSLSTIGSASKCSTECSGSAITDQWLAAKTGMKDSVKSAYAASTVTPIKSYVYKSGGTAAQAIPQKTNGQTQKVKKTRRDRDAEKLRKAFVALLLVAATESIQQSVSH